jgi:hypothetical protein
MQQALGRCETFCSDILNGIGKSPLGILRVDKRLIMRRFLNKVGGGRYWILLAQDRLHCLALKSTVTNECMFRKRRKIS